MKLGIGYGKVALQPHDGEWHRAAEETIEILRCILGDTAKDLQHVGSTAIRGIPAKPVLDIAVGVLEVSCVYRFREALEAQGIRIVGEIVPGQIMCDQMTEDGMEAMHIHFIVHDSPEWRDYMCFRDYLNAVPQEAKRYAELKTELAEKFAEDRKSYTAGKAALIQELLLKAHDWAGKKGEEHVRNL